MFEIPDPAGERWVVLRKFATAALFLASDEASFVNGVELSTAASRQSESAGNQESASQHCSVT